MAEDEEGFEYPQVDEAKCEGCYVCLMVCPVKAYARKRMQKS